MTNPPREITTPPEGYEWTGEVRPPRYNEHFATWSTNGTWSHNLCTINTATSERPILRKIKPPTVTVELPLEFAEEMAELGPGAIPSFTIIANACRAALEQEKE